MSNKSFGDKGEKIAVNYLKTKGYNILETNWRTGRIELDIIAQIEKIIVFVEVKTRKSDYYGFPEEAVNRQKQKNILDAAEVYLIEKKLDNEVRFDIISIIKNKSIEKIYHIEDAIIPYDL
jgi:putative endonuclease